MGRVTLTGSMIRLRNRHFFVLDLFLLPAAAYLAFVLRLDRFWISGWWIECLLFVSLVTLIVPVVFRRAGLYSRYWKYASLEDAALIVGAVAAGTALVAGCYALLAMADVPRFDHIPRSVPFIFFAMALPTAGGPRLLTGLVAAITATPKPQSLAMPTVIIGAGAAGAMTARELRRNAQLGFDVLGFLDDDPAKQHMRVRGVPVLGTCRDLPAIVQQHRVGRVIIAMPTAPGRVIREVVANCKLTGITPKILPGLYELLDGTVHVDQIRDVEIEDLLRREPIQTDLAAVSELLRGKRVLITGAGGSIGSELSRQVFRCRPSDLVLLGHGENSIFSIERELLRNQRNEPPSASEPPRVPATRLHAVIADISHAERIRGVFAAYQPEIVFHAAAHKHVPLMELNPAEAVTNNVLGTRNVLDAAREAGVERFVFVSTDKAVRPANVMGASKRAAELLVHESAREAGSAYMITRFGNVLGSRGSVVLTMKDQIARGGPVTVTHPEMTRFFMTIPEAVQLLLQAAALGHGGEVFVFDMGGPVRILDLAHDLIRLSGLEVGEDIDVIYTGARPGEKLYEELFLPGERYDRTLHEKIFIAANASDQMPVGLALAIDTLAAAAREGDPEEIRRAFRALVPEYQPGSPGAVPPRQPAPVRVITRPASPLVEGGVPRLKVVGDD